MDYYASTDTAVEDITAESIVSALIREREDGIMYLKASIKDFEQWLESSRNALAVAEKELDVLRTLV